MFRDRRDRGAFLDRARAKYIKAKRRRTRFGRGCLLRRGAAIYGGLAGTYLGRRSLSVARAREKKRERETGPAFPAII